MGAADATQIGIVIVILTVGGMLVGKLIDARLNVAPVGILLGIFFGIISATIFLVYKFRAVIKDSEKEYNKETKDKK